jgi:phosphoribosylamine---glycine ligase
MPLRILVIGSGGREHALCWKLSQEATVFCMPGNPGMGSDAVCVPSMPIESVPDFVTHERIDLVVFGPEDPLVLGHADVLRSFGIPVFGPSKEGALLEGSKAFSKEIMLAAGVPTAKSATCSTLEEAQRACREMFAQGFQVAVKASGNALGKGVVVCDSLDESLAAVEQLRGLGEAGSTLVIEERMFGREFSLLTLVSDSSILSLPVAQDYKRVFDGNLGPNTGGMGTYSPLDWLDVDLIVQTENEIVRPAIDELKRRGISYRGVFFSGVMVTQSGPKCLEYNVRFGDPETQTVMRRLGSGFADALLACAKGESIPAIEIHDNAVVSVVMASEGYPGTYPKGRSISNQIPPSESVKVFYAGVQKQDESLLTNGGRVLAVSAEAKTLEGARSKAYEAVGQISFEGMHYRKDIGA